VFDTCFEYEKIDEELLEGARNCFIKTGEMIEKVELKSSLQNVMAYVNTINAYLNETEPWKVIKEDKKRASGILHCALTSIDACATMFTPFMPTTSKIVSDAIQKENLNSWGINEIKKGVLCFLRGHLF
jgi:methionyl-tRNA synthetase